MPKKSLWCSLLSMSLFCSGADTLQAAEYGELVQKDGKWVFKETEDPVLKLMHDKHLITDEGYLKATDRTGKNWIEPADAVLNQRKDIDWVHYEKSLLRLPDWLDLGFENRTRFESYDHPWRTSQTIGGGRTDAQIALRSRVRIGLGGDGPLRLLFEGQDSRSFLDGDRGDFRDTTTVNQFDVLQLLGSFTVNNIFGTGLRTDIHFGRMTMDFGRRRLVARNDFRNTTNSFDGFHWQIAQDKTWRIRAFAVQPVIRDDVRLDQQYHNLLFWGTYLESKHFSWFQADAYYFALNDQRVPNGAAHRTYSTAGGRLYKDPRTGEMDYEIETSWQTGTRGVTDHFAHFQHLDLGYTFNLPWTPRLVFHYDYASGDRQPGDSQDGGFDTLFGARRFEYGPTGIWGPFSRTNLNSPGWRLIVTPTPNVVLQVKHRVSYLAQSKDFFGNTGLRDATGSAGTSLGHDVELRAQWAVTSNLDFDVGYVHWFKGSYFDRLPASAGLPAGGNKDSDYFYAAVRVRI
ncbi:MAG TPA: alginate export family protein [Nitrospira sp.]|nr:alginate export family protein [Nitrospira sp.]